jgi:hypothetical protein
MQDISESGFLSRLKGLLEINDNESSLFNAIDVVLQAADMGNVGSLRAPWREISWGNIDGSGVAGALGS